MIRGNLVAAAMQSQVLTAMLRDSVKRPCCCAVMDNCQLELMAELNYMPKAISFSAWFVNLIAASSPFALIARSMAWRRRCLGSRTKRATCSPVYCAIACVLRNELICLMVLAGLRTDPMYWRRTTICAWSQRLARFTRFRPGKRTGALARALALRS